MYSPDLARDPRIAQMPGMVERLAESDDIEVLVALAENPALPEFPPGALALLMSSPAMEVVLRRDDLPWEHPRFAPYAILRGEFADHKQTAQRPDLDKYPEAARALAHHPDRKVRNLLAANPAIMRIEGLADEIAQTESDLDAQIGLASNSAIPQRPDIAMRLTHGEREARIRLAGNPSIAQMPDVARTLAKGDPIAQVYLADNPAIAYLPDVARDLARGSQITRLRLADNPAIAQLPDVVRELANSDQEVRRALAINPALPSFPHDVIQRLLQDSSCFWRICLRYDLPWDQPPFAPYAVLHGPDSEHENFAKTSDLTNSPEIAQLLLDHPSLDVQRALAANPTIAHIDGLVEKIANSDAWNAREGLARNPAIAHFPHIVQTLAQDKHDAVRSALASNPVIAYFPEIAERLALDRTMHYRLAANDALPSLPSTVLEQIFSPGVFWQILRERDDLPWDKPPLAAYKILRGTQRRIKGVAKRLDVNRYPKAAKMLLEAPFSDLREGLASNPTVGHSDLVEHIAQDNDWKVRAALASNPAISETPEVVRRLAQDAQVRPYLAQNPALASFPEDVIQAMLSDIHLFFEAICKRTDLPWDRPPFAPYAILQGDRRAHLEAARRPDLGNYPVAAMMLSQAPYIEIAMQLASNPAIVQVPGLFEKLEERARTISAMLYLPLATNPAIADFPGAAKRLARDHPLARYHLAANPAIAKMPDIIRILAADEDENVRLALAQNPALQQRKIYGWIEIKTIDGRRYRYLRWREGGKKRSRYIGKAATGG